jgi:NTE family protein
MIVMSESVNKRPTIGLALGSGSARGFAHLGVLKVLHENNIKIDYIAGSSMGALIGCFYAANNDIDRLYKIAQLFNKKYFIDLTVPKMGFIVGKKIKEMVQLFTYNKKIEDLATPLSIIATDLLSGDKIIFNEGDISDAVRASISIPGIFIPYKYQDRTLIDGGVVDRIPVSVVKEMGADIVIGVNVSPVMKYTEITTIYDVIIQSLDIMQNELLKLRDENSDVMIKPDVAQFHPRAFTQLEEIIGEGEKSAVEALPLINEKIASWKEKFNEEC